MAQSFVWLASYPRSGNTLLRTILNHCFGLKSASIYPNDLGGNEALAQYVGHIEHKFDATGKLYLPELTIPLVKTHSLPQSSEDTIYIVRDGRAASISLWEFYKRTVPLENFITGHNIYEFSTWTAHLEAWAPWSRPNCLFLKYESLVKELSSVIAELAVYLDREPISQTIPSRDKIAVSGGKWVRPKSDWRQSFSDEKLKLFSEVNGATMEKLGYDQSHNR